MGYRIAEVAELTSVSATAIRYYEDAGLLRPPPRAANGYRTYGEHDVARLRFVNRARSLGLGTDDLRELVEVWEGDDCSSVADRLRGLVADRLRETQQQIAELAARASELQQLAVRLHGEPHVGACVEEECVCLDRSPVRSPLPLIAPTGREREPIACTLDAAALPQRMDDWQRLLERAADRMPIDGGVSVRFPVNGGVAAQLTTLVAAEQGCCSFFSFTIRVTADAMHLEVRTPPDAAPMLAALLGQVA